jgi:predicted esterase
LKPHGGQPLLHEGVTLEAARGAVVLVHGRGATAQSILALGRELPHPHLAYLAPQAAGNTWYPNSFLAPLEANEPGLSSGLERLRKVTDTLQEHGIPARRTLIAGFSQGACLALEFSARNPERCGAVLAFTGGLIGPEGTPRGYAGRLDGVPVFLGSGDPDPHVPWWRVEETAKILEGMGAEVDMRRYPGLPHTISQDEIDAARGLLGRVMAS